MPSPEYPHGESSYGKAGDAGSEPDHAAERAPQEAQMRLLVEAYGDEVGKGPANWQRVGIQYLYRQHHILVRDEYVERVMRLIPGSEVREPVVHGVTLLRVPDPALDTLARIRGPVAGRPEGAAPEGAAPQARRGADEAPLGPGVASVDHLISICPPPDGTGAGCPATEPDPDPHMVPDPGVTSDCAAGEGIRVVVVDTGLDPDSVTTHRWMARVTGETDLAVPPGPSEQRPLGPYAGHGTFIAGVIRSVAPRAEVIVKRILFKAGATYESSLVQALDRVLEDDFPDVISMSAGTWTFDPTGLLGLTVFNETGLGHHKGVVLGAAAGNDNSRRSFWPAAAPWTISVGALSHDWRRRAQFSNFGRWVDVYAPGENLVNAFPVGTYTYREQSRPHHVPQHQPGDQAVFTGMARWSGTSFSTPMVAGLIAARMSRTGENGKDAGAAVLAEARAGALFGLGAILLPR